MEFTPEQISEIISKLTTGELDLQSSAEPTPGLEISPIFLFNLFIIVLQIDKPNPVPF